MTTRSTTMIAAVVLMAGMAALLGAGCGHSRETTAETAPAKAPAIPSTPFQGETSPSAAAASPDRPVPATVAAAAAAPAKRPAAPAAVNPGQYDGVAPSVDHEVRQTAHPFPRPEDVPLAPMGEKVRPSMLVNAPGYYPVNDPEAESFLTGRRKAAVVEIPFTGGESSPERLALAILEGVRTGDPRALHALRVTEDEFTRIMWPEFPQSRPICNNNGHDAFFFLDRKCHSGVGLGLTTWGGQEMELEGIAYTVGRAPYLNFTLYHGVQLHVRMANGEEAIVKFTQTFAERRGVWKVYTYQDKED